MKQVFAVLSFAALVSTSAMAQDKVIREADKTVFRKKTTIDFTDVWANAAVGGDPETPVFLADSGDEIRFRLLKPGGHNRNQVFTLHGHLWPRHPYSADSSSIDRDNPYTFWHGEQQGHGPTNHVNVVPLHGAGGALGQAGDYLFRDMTPVHVDNGEWGILRVTAQ